MTLMKIGQFSRPSTPLSRYVQDYSTPLTLDVQFQTNPLLLQIITNQLKENIIQGWLLNIIRSFLQVDLCSQYQLFNLVWLSIDFQPFSWSQPCPQSYFRKLKTSFSPSFYSEKKCWGQGCAEASLSAFFVAFFVALYFCVCSSPKISENPFYL